MLDPAKSAACFRDLVNSAGLAASHPLRRLAVAALVAAMLYVCFFHRLGGMGFVGPDEPRYAEIAREMTASGDWVTPRLFGQPWFEKPALLYWLAAACFRAGLAPEVAARLPSALLATLAALAVAWAARRIYGDRAAFFFLMMFPASVGAVGFARAAATDMPFSACLALGMVAASQLIWDSDPRKRAAWAGGWGIALGLATLAKGPGAVVLAAGSVAFWTLATRRWRDALRLFHSVGIVLFCATALPWYLLCAAQNPGFLRIFLLEHNVERYITPRYQHLQPIWFFVPILLLAMVPWTSLILPAVRDAVAAIRQKRLRDSPGFFFACWVIFPFLFFTASQSKLPGYLLPVMAPLLLLFARSLERAIEANDGILRAGLYGMVILFVVLAGAPYHFIRRLPDEFAAYYHAFWLPFSLESLGIAVVAVALIRLRRYAIAVPVAAILLAACLFASLGKLLTEGDLTYSARPAARLAQSVVRTGDSVATFGLRRATVYGLNFYFGRELPEWAPGQPKPTFIITTGRGEAALRAMGFHLRWQPAALAEFRVFRVY